MVEIVRYERHIVLKILKQNGIASMVEIVITSIVFLIAAFGIITTTSMLRPKATASTKELEALYVAKSFFAKLRSSVDASTFDTGDLKVCLNCRNEVDTDGDGKNEFTIFYNIADDPSGSRAVNVTVNWQE